MGRVANGCPCLHTEANTEKQGSQRWTVDTCWLFVPALLLALLPPGHASAGVFFGKKTKTTPTERVPELIKELKTDGDEHKRSSAAEEMRQYDPQQFPEMIPALIESLLNDNKPGVRSEAAQTLAKLRPVNTAAGNALEQALAKDPSMRVRLQARSSLLQYRWAGYSSTTTTTAAKAKDEAPPQSKEPPLAPELPAGATPKLAPVPATASGSVFGPRPLPAGTPVKRTAPAPTAPVRSDVPARTLAAPASILKTPKVEEEKGPDLTPP